MNNSSNKYSITNAVYMIVIATIIAVIFFAPSMGNSTAVNGNDNSFIVSYADKYSVSDALNFTKYDVIVFDGFNHPVLRPLVIRHKKVLANISLGYARKHKKFYEDIKNSGAFIAADNKKEYIDVRNPKWAELLIHKIIPEMVHSRFNGLMLDDLKAVISLELKNPRKYAGMIEASVNLIKAIKMHYPYLDIMVKRSSQIVPQIAENIDMILVDGAITYIDKTDNSYKYRSAEEINQLAEWRKNLSDKYPHISFFSIDYWDMSDKKNIQNIYDTQRKTGFIPHIREAKSKAE